MSIKTLAKRATGRMAGKVLVARHHSPTMMMVAGGAGVLGTVVLACKATLKLPEVLDQAEKELVEVNPEDAKTSEAEETLKKAKFGVQLKTAGKVVKLYAPSAVLGVASVGMMTGSHVILKRRNTSLAAAYVAVDKSFKAYRARVVADQGAEKDLEYRFGTIEREIVEEGENGPEVKFVKQLDTDAVKSAEAVSYARVFDEYNPQWEPSHMKNSFFVQGAQNLANDTLRLKGFLFLNQVYEMLGFEPTQAGSEVGWLRDPKEGEGDGYVDFGLAAQPYEATKFIQGRINTITLDFNVDGPIKHILPRM